CLPNPFGTAAGLHVRLPAGRTGAPWDADVFCLPGPPRELQPMFRDQLLPSLRLDPSLTTRTRLLHVLAVPESDVAARLAHLTRRQDVGESPLLAMTASGGILTLRARIRTSAGQSGAGAALDAMEGEIRSVLGQHVIPGHGQVGVRGESALASCVVQQLRQSGRSLSVAESCTGGMIGGLVTSVSGSSAAFVGGVYSNELKARLLSVSQSDLATHGAVSEPVARAMAIGALKLTGASDALSVTGIAGPEGGSDAKPVGTVFLGYASKEASGEVWSNVRKCLVTGDRHDVRQRSAISALSMLYFAQAMGFEQSRAVRLNWQVDGGSAER
ncbi:MAG: nicotinamide-nucleotide amidohydrolase family protein, partial [Phycisphaerales bacterium]|nr:nicotinamide-nucleotide amidohydrolase family protein [Phycisphaerales bacterium]